MTITEIEPVEIEDFEFADVCDPANHEQCDNVAEWLAVWDCCDSVVSLCDAHKMICDSGRSMAIDNDDVVLCGFCGSQNRLRTWVKIR